MAGFLPSLAMLGLGAPTDGNADGKRPMGSGSGSGGGDDAPSAKAARVEDDESDSPLRPGSRWVAPPPPLSLRGMPPAVIAILVGQAALSARKARIVAWEVCRWMRNFCEVAASSGVPCDDDWFRLALGAFGPVPEAPVGPMVFPDRDGKTRSGYVDVWGNEVAAPKQSAPPPQSGFRTWRQLFKELCVALNGHEVLWQRSSAFIFWKEVSIALYGTESAAPYRVRAEFASASLSQRRLDELLDALLARLLPSAAESQQARAEALDQLKEQWGAWLRGDAPTAEWQREVGTWKALLTLLLMRGANPFQSALYNSLDRSMYAAITSAMHHDIPWNDALARVRDALDAGANPNFDGSGMKDAGLPAPSFLATFNPEEPSEWPPVLNVALVSGEVDLVKLLVDAGAVYGRGRHRFPLDKFWDALNVYLRLLLGKVANMPEGQEENDIQETTMKVLKMLEEKCAAMRGSAAHHMAARLNYWRTVNRALVATRLAWVYQTIERIQNMLALAPAHNRRVVEDSDDDSDEEE